MSKKKSTSTSASKAARVKAATVANPGRAEDVAQPAKAPEAAAVSAAPTRQLFRRRPQRHLPLRQRKELQELPRALNHGRDHRAHQRPAEKDPPAPGASLTLPRRTRASTRSRRI